MRAHFAGVQDLSSLWSSDGCLGTALAAADPPQFSLKVVKAALTIMQEKYPDFKPHARASKSDSSSKKRPATSPAYLFDFSSDSEIEVGRNVRPRLEKDISNFDEFSQELDMEDSTGHRHDGMMSNNLAPKIKSSRKHSFLPIQRHSSLVEPDNENSSDEDFAEFPFPGDGFAFGDCPVFDLENPP